MRINWKLLVPKDKFPFWNIKRNSEQTNTRNALHSITKFTLSVQGFRSIGTIDVDMSLSSSPQDSDPSEKSGERARLLPLLSHMIGRALNDLLKIDQLVQALSSQEEIEEARPLITAVVRSRKVVAFRSLVRFGDLGTKNRNLFPARAG